MSDNEVSFENDVQRGRYELRGSIITPITGGTTDNLHAATSINGFAAKFKMGFTAIPSFLIGLYTGTDYNQPYSVGVQITPKNEVALITSPGAPIVDDDPKNVTVNGADQSAVAALATRRYLFLKNISTGGQIIYLAFGKTAVANKGIILGVGEGYDMSIAQGNLRVTEVRAIASAAGGVLSFQEGA